MNLLVVNLEAMVIACEEKVIIKCVHSLINLSLNSPYMLATLHVVINLAMLWLLLDSKVVNDWSSFFLTAVLSAMEGSRLRNELDLIEVLRKFPWLAIDVWVLHVTEVYIEANFLCLLFWSTETGFELLAFDSGVVWTWHEFLHCKWRGVVFHITVFKAHCRWTERIVPLFILLIHDQVASC